MHGWEYSFPHRHSSLTSILGQNHEIETKCSKVKEQAGNPVTKNTKIWKHIHKEVLAVTRNAADMQVDADKGQKEEIASFQR